MMSMKKKRRFRIGDGCYYIYCALAAGTTSQEYHKDLASGLSTNDNPLSPILTVLSSILLTS